MGPPCPHRRLDETPLSRCPFLRPGAGQSNFFFAVPALAIRAVRLGRPQGPFPKRSMAVATHLTLVLSVLSVLAVALGVVALCARSWTPEILSPPTWPRLWHGFGRSWGPASACSVISCVSTSLSGRSSRTFCLPSRPAQRVGVLLCRHSISSRYSNSGPLARHASATHRRVQRDKRRPWSSYACPHMRTCTHASTHARTCTHVHARARARDYRRAR